MWNFGFSAGWSTDVAVTQLNYGPTGSYFYYYSLQFYKFYHDFFRDDKKLILSEQLFYNWNIAIVTII